MALLFVVAFVALMGAMAAAFVALVAHRYRRDRARRESWSALGARLGLRHEAGDPWGLAARLGVTRVSETLWGFVDGARVAAFTASVFRTSGEPLGAGSTLSTFSGAVAAVDPPSRFDADAARACLGGPDDAGVHVTVSPSGDLVLLVPAGGGWRSLHDPADAPTVERLLRQAAWVERNASIHP